MVETEPGTRTRRRFKFSPRSLMLAFVVASLALGWFSPPLQRWRALATLRKMGADIWFDYQRTPYHGVREWMRRHLEQFQGHST